MSDDFSIDGLVDTKKAFEPERMTLLVVEKDRAGLSHNMRSRLKRIEEEITWIREIEPSIVTTYRGQIIAENGTYNDFYGFEGSLNQAISDARQIMIALDVPQDETRLAIEVKARIIDSPTLGFVGEKFRKKWHRPLPERVIFHDDSRVKDGDPFDFDTFPFERRHILRFVDHCSRTIWSSLRSDSLNEETISDFLATANSAVRHWPHPAAEG